MANSIPTDMIENYFKIVFLPWLDEEDKKNISPTWYYKPKNTTENKGKRR